MQNIIHIFPGNIDDLQQAMKIFKLPDIWCLDTISAPDADRFLHIHMMKEDFRPYLKYQSG